mgnify:CR=1 FL=1
MENEIIEQNGKWTKNALKKFKNQFHAFKFNKNKYFSCAHDTQKGRWGKKRT